MATIKTLIKLDSSDAFPIPFNITKTSNESVVGEYGMYRNATVNPGDNLELFSSASATGKSGVLYLYVEAATTNPLINSVDIGLLNNSTGSTLYFSRLIAGDALWVPILGKDANGFSIIVRNTDTTNPASITYMTCSKD